MDDKVLAGAGGYKHPAAEAEAAAAAAVSWPV